jgi:hypothetical protein
VEKADAVIDGLLVDSTTRASAADTTPLIQNDNATISLAKLPSAFQTGDARSDHDNIR